MSNGVRAQYAGVLEDLERKKIEADNKLARLQLECVQVQAYRDRLVGVIAALKDQMDERVQDSPNSPIPQPRIFPLYANLSMRWAILRLFGEGSAGPLSNEVIALRLKDGGFNTGTANKFRGNVNAVLSRMASHDEVLKTEAGYELTQNGMGAWQAIKNSDKFAMRHQDPATPMFPEEEVLEREAS